MTATAYKDKKTLEFNDSTEARKVLSSAGYVFKKPTAKKTKKAE